MKTFKLLSCGLMIVAFVGCTNRSRPGGAGERSQTFTIDGPALTTSIKAGETQTLHLKLNRGSNFNHDVKLKVDAPPGIDVTPRDTNIKPAEKSDVDIKVAVGSNTTPGEHIIHVVGTPDNGAATTLDLKVKVIDATGKTDTRSDNTKLQLHGPTAATTIKQGETKTVKISIDREPKYLVPVKVHTDAPKGLRAEMTADTLKASDGSDLELRITADKNATVGEHTIHVTGKGDAATVTPVDVKVNVVAK